MKEKEIYSTISRAENYLYETSIWNKKRRISKQPVSVKSNCDTEIKDIWTADDFAIKEEK